MNVAQTVYKTDIARLADDNAKRDTRLLLTVAAIMALGIATLGLILS